jgi:hypothetical protein
MEFFWESRDFMTENFRDENPTGPGFGPGPKTLIFLNFKNPDPNPSVIFRKP